jgi:hypothetical protein
VNLLALMQDFSAKWGLPAPSSIVGNTNATYKQLLALAHESMRELARFEWEKQKSRVSFTMLGSEDQGTLASVFGASFRSLIPGTMWNDTFKTPIFGPPGDSSWQLWKEFAGNPWAQYKIMGGHLRIFPAPTAGHVLTALVMSDYMVRDNLDTAKSRFTVDDDSPAVPDDVFLADLEWRWLKQKGEPWVSAQERAAELITSGMIRAGGMSTYALDGGGSGGLRPGIVVPAGSWPV